MALVFVYCGCDWRTQPSFVAWANSLAEGSVKAGSCMRMNANWNGRHDDGFSRSAAST